MALGILVEPNRARKEIRHRFLLGDGQLHISERAGRHGLAFLFGGFECGSHQIRAVIIRTELPGVPNSNLHFPERFEDGRIILSSKKCRVDFAGNQRMELPLGQQMPLSVRFEIVS